MSGFRASELYKKSNQGKVMIIIDEIVHAIDDKILDKNKAGECEVEYPLPEYFDVTSLSRSDIQLVVYSRIIEQFSRRGFDVKLTKDTSILKIRWTNILDEKEKARMKDILKEHLV